MKSLYLVLLTVCLSQVHGQYYRQTKFEETVHGLTTIVNIFKKKGNDTFGTGFFYHKYSGANTKIDSCVNAIDSTLESIWLITNKHVLFGSDQMERLNPEFPRALDFHLRKRVKNRDRPIWDTIKIQEQQLKTLVRLHKDSSVDIVAINITDYVLPKLKSGDSLYYYGAVSRVNFPNDNLPITLTGFGIVLGQEILSVGYPRNFYDRYNLFPTVKSGIIASKWKAKFNGKPYFLIDSKLFPGSSGSIIITRSVHYEPNTGGFDYFNFLGVYSGEPFVQSRPIEFDDMTLIRRETYNIGIVWYNYIIEEIMK